jgi:hypothetical protein
VFERWPNSNYTLPQRWANQVSRLAKCWANVVMMLAQRSRITLAQQYYIMLAQRKNFTLAQRHFANRLHDGPTCWLNVGPTTIALFPLVGSMMAQNGC